MWVKQNLAFCPETKSTAQIPPQAIAWGGWWLCRATRSVVIPAQAGIQFCGTQNLRCSAKLHRFAPSAQTG
ncbi:MAG: hypothetical protein IJU89_02800, partial [Alphaproteobacteria bacterium]|nr:hypothetical protein [Alphaproteobacteria bacterium]